MSAFNPAIHAAHTRRRGKKSHPVTRLVVAVLFLGAAYVIFASWLWLREPTIAFDPLVRLEEMTPKAGADQAAWPKYRDALAWTREARKRTVDGVGDDGVSMSLLEVGTAHPSWEDAAALINSHQKEIAAIREASARPALGFMPRLGYTEEDAAYFGEERPQANEEFSQDFPAYAVALPQFAELRIASRMLRLDALAAAQRGESARATDDVIAMLRIAKHVAEIPILISGLVGNAITSAAAATTTEVLDGFPKAIRRDDLVRLEAAFAGINAKSTRFNMDGERMVARDIVQRIYTDGGNGDGSALPARFWQLRVLLRPMQPADRAEVSSDFAAFLAGPFTWATSSGRAETEKMWLDILDEAEAQSELPAFKQAFTHYEALEREVQDSGLTSAHFPLGLLAPALSGAARQSCMTRNDANVARVRIALQRYHLDNGKWPAALSDLVPKYLPAVPQDELVDKPLGYELTDGKPRVWAEERQR